MKYEKENNLLGMVKMNKEDEIRQIAHRIWLKENKPDGDILTRRFGRTMTLKEAHFIGKLL